ncbi:hypothetical protein AK812_SmicGene47498 [Symbiodinium microadriaticum]|uniref:Uncharacterized protein n=1 Tax=Symbiodinium microadriaticum TaxID=2951 RepID=A0A1Q9BRS1_SYMMI|nr:hypothetical protein AK812_SmicGene47498 [Symbiodinium microadriaticum]CAE7778238.1 unnamed protein product [Symbiodinium microadriaticum]CAE7849440.1 unnamed protein product [Symbiodinium sp. KB8]
MMTRAFCQEPDYPPPGFEKQVQVKKMPQPKFYEISLSASEEEEDEAAGSTGACGSKEDPKKVVKTKKMPRPKKETWKTGSSRSGGTIARVEDGVVEDRLLSQTSLLVVRSTRSGTTGSWL